MVGTLHSHRERLGSFTICFLFGVGSCRWMWMGSMSVLLEVEGWGERDWMLNFTLNMVKLEVNLNKRLRKIALQMSWYTANNVSVVQIK